MLRRCFPLPRLPHHAERLSENPGRQVTGGRHGVGHIFKSDLAITAKFLVDAVLTNFLRSRRSV